MLLTPELDLTRCGILMWKVHKDSNWWLRVMQATWSIQMDLQGRVFFWRVMVGALPIASVMLQRGFTNRKFPRCLKGQETLRHTFWYCPLVWEWWNQLWALLLSHTGITLNLVSFTFGTFSYVASEHTWMVQHLWYRFLWLVWSSRNEALHSGQIWYFAGLPWYLFKSRLQEAAVTDPVMCSNTVL